MDNSIEVGKIFAAGRGLNPILIRHFIGLTGKKTPRVGLLPTASGDHPEWIENWKNLGSKLGFEPVIQPMFISSFTQDKTFREVLLGCDAIYVGGGNTVNMLAVWEVQGILPILREALANGIPLGGGSAGGICWFEGGLTDSRPIELTAMDALGWISGSFAPHYLSEPGRRQYFHKYILAGELGNGYACDDSAALLFENGQFIKAVGSEPDSAAFRVEMENGKIVESPLLTEYVGD